MYAHPRPTKYWGNNYVLSVYAQPRPRKDWKNIYVLSVYAHLRPRKDWTNLSMLSQSADQYLLQKIVDACIVHCCFDFYLE